MIPIKETADGVVFTIQVSPRSSKSEITGCQGESLKIKITSPPVEGKANEGCIRFLADLFRIRKDRINIVAGLKSRKKTVAIKGLNKKDVEVIISAA